MKILVSNNFAGDIMSVRIIHATPDIMGAYIHIDGYISTHAYKYKTTTSPYYHSESTEGDTERGGILRGGTIRDRDNSTDNSIGDNSTDNSIGDNSTDNSIGDTNTSFNNTFTCEWNIPLNRNLIPSFKSKNFSVYYEMAIILVQVKHKLTYRARTEIYGNNFDCCCDVDIENASNEEYYRVKRALSQRRDRNNISDDKGISDNKGISGNISDINTAVMREVFIVKEGTIVKHEITSIASVFDEETNSSVDFGELIKQQGAERDGREKERERGDTIERGDTRDTSTNSTNNNISNNISSNDISSSYNRLGVLKDRPFFRLPNCIKLNTTPQCIKIKNGSDLIAILEIKEILERTDTFCIKYRSNIHSTEITLVEQNYEGVEMIDAIFSKPISINTNHCVERIFDIKFTEEHKEPFSIKTEKFERRYMMIVNLDDFEIIVPLKIAYEKSLIEYTQD